MGFFSVLCLLCHCARLIIWALWSPAGKGLTSWLSFVVSNCEFVTFPCGVLGQVWCLIVSIPDLCTFTYFGWHDKLKKKLLLYVGREVRKPVFVVSDKVRFKSACSAKETT